MALSVDSHLAVTNIIGSSIVLHNRSSMVLHNWSTIVLHTICETCGKYCLDEWMVEEESHNSGGCTSNTATAPQLQQGIHRDELQ